MRARAMVLGRVLANRRLVRIELAFLGFGTAEYGVWVAVLVYAYQHGGTTTAAVIAVLQLIPAAITAPLAARAVDRRGAGVVLSAGYLLQALTLAACASLMLSHAAPGGVYATAVLAAMAVTLTRPAQGALLPGVVATPMELTAANAVSGWVESVSVLVGPALAGGWIAWHGPGAAIAFFAAVMVLAALGAADLRDARVEAGTDPVPSEAEAASSLREALHGERGIAPVIGVMALQFVAVGALDVLSVVLALRQLDLGASGAGYLAAAFGAGGVAGGIGALALLGRERLVGFVVGAALGWAGALVLLGLWPSVAGAFALLAVAGIGRSLLDISGRTIMHRVVPPAVYGRAFGLLEGFAMLGLAVGSILVPVLVSLGGVRTALLGVGGLLAAGTMAMLGRLRVLERATPSRARELALLRSFPIFSVLTAPVLAGLAQALTRETATDGEAVVREGQPGHHFYLVDQGKLAVTAGGRRIRTISPGDGFGEIALLRDGIRTATVTAEGPVTLYALERTPFLEALTASPQATATAHRLAAERLAAG